MQVDLRNGEQFSPAFRAINPDCTVPALVLDDGTVIADAVAICDYLEELHPEPPLIGTTPQERAVVTALNRQIERDGFFAAMDAFRNAAKGLKGRALPGPHDYEQIPELAARGRVARRALLPRHGCAPRRPRVRGRAALHHRGYFDAGADRSRRPGQAVRFRRSARTCTAGMRRSRRGQVVQMYSGIEIFGYSLKGARRIT